MAAYFSNGTEAMLYEGQFCEKCLHYSDETGCPVLNAHWIAASDKDAKFHINDSPARMVLDTFIPRDADGVNQACTMFLGISKLDDGIHVTLSRDGCEYGIETVAKKADM
jgi:hypothetical protein